MTQFDQPGYAMYKSLESLLVQAANGQKYDQQLDNVTALDKADFDRALLSTQLQNLGKWFADREPKKMGTVSFAECVVFLQASHSCRSPFSVTFVDLRSWSWSCQLQTQLVNVVFQPLGISKPTYTAPRARAGWTMSCCWASTTGRWTNWTLMWSQSTLSKVVNIETK